MNFLFVDRILELEPGKRVVGIKHVTPADMYLRTVPYDERPLLFPCIIGEALGQLGAWAVMKHNDFTHRAVAGRVGEVDIIGDVFVGDTVILEADIDALTSDGMFYQAKARVNDKVVLTLSDTLGPLLPMEEFIDTATVRQQFDMINRPGEVPVSKPTKANLGEKVPGFSGVGFDHILEWDKGQQIVAQKNVSFNAPYFIDHFPRKPVLPLTLLLQAKLDLAAVFIKDLLGEEDAKAYRPRKISNVKMTRFVQPGASIITTMALTEQTDQVLQFKFSTQLDGKRICVAKAEFERSQEQA